jgi:hypothetical protein
VWLYDRVMALPVEIGPGGNQPLLIQARFRHQRIAPVSKVERELIKLLLVERRRADL